MINSRDLQQRALSCLSFSFLLHGTVGIGIALAPAYVLPPATELAEGIFIEDSNFGLPKGEQLEALPAAGPGTDPAPAPATAQLPATPTPTTPPAPTEEIKAAAQQPVPPPEPQPAAPVAESAPTETVAAPVIPKALPEKKAKVVAAPKPKKPAVVKATAKAKETDNDESNVQAALHVARAQKQDEDTNAPTDDAAPEKDLDDELEAAAFRSDLAADTDAEAEKNRILKEEAQQAANETPEEEQNIEPTPLPPPSRAARTQEAVAQIPTSSKSQEEMVPASRPMTNQGLSQPMEEAKNSNTGLTNAPGGRGNALPYGVRDADDLAEAAGNRPPIYPERDRLMRNQGVVLILAFVNPDGSLSNAQIRQGTNSTTLDQAALTAFRKYRFQPGQSTWTLKKFVFQLNGKTDERPARLRR